MIGPFSSFNSFRV